MSRDLPYIDQGQRLRESRFCLGNEGQAAFGQRLGGFSVAQISQAERGRNLPPPKMLYALAKEGININYILTGDGNIVNRSLLRLDRPVSREELEKVAEIAQRLGLTDITIGRACRDADRPGFFYEEGGGVTAQSQTRHGGAGRSGVDAPGRHGMCRAPCAPAVEGVLRTGGTLRVGPIEIGFDGFTLAVRNGGNPVAFLARWNGGYRFIAHPVGSALPELVEAPPPDLPLVTIGQGDSRREIREEDLLP